MGLALGRHRRLKLAPRETRDALEKAQQEARELRKKVSSLNDELELTKAQLKQSQGEQERLTRLLLKDWKPAGQKSAFSIDDVPALVAYLKKK